MPEVIAERFRRTVVIDEPVVLPLDVGQLGIDVAADLAMESQLVGQVLETPTDVLIPLAQSLGLGSLQECRKKHYQ